MTARPPIYWEWTDDGTMKPHPRFAKRCDKEFVVGDTYRLEARSRRSHNTYFAAVAEVWHQLPDETAAHFATDEHLRAWALVRCGYYTKQHLVLSTAPDALMVVEAFRALNEFAVIVVDGRIVSIYKPKSQSLDSMPKKEFEQSKQVVLEFICGMIGVSVEELIAEVKRKCAERSALRNAPPIDEEEPGPLARMLSDDTGDNHAASPHLNADEAGGGTVGAG